MVTKAEARACVRETFYPLWRDRVAASGLITYEPEIYWNQLDTRNIAGQQLPPADQVWANFFIINENGTQSSLGGIGARRFTDTGLVTFRLFQPSGDGLTLSDELGNIAKNILRDDVARVIFTRNVQDNDIGTFHSWYQTDITAEIEYDAIL